MMGIEFEPYVCRECRDIVNVAVAVHLGWPDAPDLYRCPECGGMSIEPFSYELPPDPELGSQPVSDPCPKCGGVLALVDVGVWD
jgi:hypothetical protein